MPFEVKLPDIGEGVAEGEIVRWLVKVGDRVREDQPLVEVMTDKASVEIPSPRTGVITALLVEEGKVVDVGTTLVAIEVDGGDASASPASSGAAHAAGAAVKSAGPAVAAPKAPATRVQATPAVRQLAKQLGVALESIAGTGPGGTITAKDVEGAASAATAPAASPPPSPGTGGGEERIPLRGLRRKIADHMRHAIATAAHFTFVAECDMTEMMRHREQLRSRAGTAGVKLTPLAFVVKALCASLERFPMLNASLDDARSEIVVKHAHHIGVATHTPDGLVVPVIHDADHLSLFGLAREIDRLAEAARAQRLKLEEVQGGTFTVTSTGARGGVLATPILHHPQVAILGVHEIKKRPAVVNDQIVIRELVNLSLSLDHRVVDGAVAADFLYDLVDRLEHPDRWLSETEIG